LNKSERALNKLKSIIGDSLFDEVCEQMPGENIHIPVFRGGYVTIEERNKAIRSDIWNGLPVKEATEKWGLSFQQIYKIMGSRG
jgi:Mor family transcriptional regulator